MQLFNIGEVSLSKICLDDNIDLYNEKELNDCSDDGTKLINNLLARILIK
jgi:hypothetical protein